MPRGCRGRCRALSTPTIQSIIRKGLKMKTYHVELKRTSYINITVEAENKDAAEDAAWLELQTGDYDDINADWLLSYVGEV
jgi:hypothetical protein